MIEWNDFLLLHFFPHEHFDGRAFSTHKKEEN